MMSELKIKQEIKIFRLGEFNHGFFWTSKRKQLLSIKTFFKNNGDVVEAGEVLCELESAYCLIELESTTSGILHWTYGDKKVFQEGDLLGYIEDGGS